MVIGLKLGNDKKFRFKFKSVIAFLSIVGIVVVSAMFILNESYVKKIQDNPVVEGYMTVGKHTNNVLASIGGVFSDLFHFKSNADKLEEMKLENEKLRKELVTLKSNNSKADALERLKRSLNYVSSDDKVKVVSARVIGKNNGDWFKSFIIDAGADSGIRKDSIVINGDGAIGIVYNVTNKYSKAISLLDSRASISFKVVGNDQDKGIITTSQAVGVSSLKDVNKLLSGYMFDYTSNIKVDDEIVTSGLGLYPENIPIGKISEVINEKNKSMKIVKIRPYVDFKSIDYVVVVPPRKLD